MKKAVAAVIVAGGQGSRFGGPVRKQYLRLKNRPLLWWALQAFSRSESIGTLIVVVPSEDVARVTRMTRRWKLPKLACVIAGGATRQESVRLGVVAVPEAYEWISVHDAVRPLITSQTIDAVIAGARSTGAAIAAVPTRDTVKIADHKGFIASTPVREHVWLAQTPQIFRRALLLQAHEASQRFVGTDDAQLVERLGVRVRLIKSSPENLKVTVPMDLKMARHLLKGR